MKSSTIRLQLSRETLRRLDETELTGVVGGATEGEPFDPNKVARRTDN